jgi:hypothetical protein
MLRVRRTRPDLLGGDFAKMSRIFGIQGSSMVEQPAVNRRVAGSSPASGAIFVLITYRWSRPNGYDQTPLGIPLGELRSLLPLCGGKPTTPADATGSGWEAIAIPWRG